MVNKSYLKEKAKTHNLKLVEFKPFLEEPGNMLSKYEVDGDKTSRDNVRKIRSSNAMMMWAKFNSYFIFQKVRGKEWEKRVIIGLMLVLWFIIFMFYVLYFIIFDFMYL